MSYCTVQDLEGYFLGKSFKCGDYLSNGKAEEFIVSDAAIINAYLGAKYGLPITNNQDLVLLKIINEKMVVGTIDDIFREKSDDGKFDRGRNTRKEAMDMLKMIKEGSIVLESTGKASLIKFNNVRSDGEEVVKRFKDENIDNI